MTNACIHACYIIVRVFLCSTLDILLWCFDVISVAMDFVHSTLDILLLCFDVISYGRTLCSGIIRRLDTSKLHCATLQNSTLKEVHRASALASVDNLDHLQHLCSTLDILLWCFDMISVAMDFVHSTLDILLLCFDVISYGRTLRSGTHQPSRHE